MGSYSTYCGRITLAKNVQPAVLAAVKCMVSHQYPDDINHPAFWFFNKNPTLSSVTGTSPWEVAGLRSMTALVELDDGRYEFQFCACSKQDFDVYKYAVAALTRNFVGRGPEHGDLLLVQLEGNWKRDREIDKVMTREYTWMTLRYNQPQERVIHTEHPFDYYPGWFDPFVNHITSEAGRHDNTNA